MIRKCLKVGKIMMVMVVLTSLNFLLYLQSNTSIESSFSKPCNTAKGITERKLTQALSCDNCNHKLSECENKLARTIRNVLKEVSRAKSLLSDDKKEQMLMYETSLKSMLTEFDTSSTAEKRIPKYSCPETYKGSTFGYPYFLKGFMRQNCGKQSIFNSTSLVLDRPVIERKVPWDMLKFVKQGFRDVFMIVEDRDKDKFKSSKSVNGIQIIYARSNVNLAIISIVSLFVVIASHLGRFDNTSDIERLIHVQEVSGADIVGSAVKNIKNGEWDRGCYQSQLKLYTLKYISGYHKSEHECLHCHYLVSPFLARTEFLREIQFSKINHGVYRDLFLRLKNKNKKVLACPDVLFYVKRVKQADALLTHFANVWDIKKIIESDNGIRWYGSRKGFKHTDGKCNFHSTMGIPTCCRANLADVLKFILKQCDENNILCELQEGTLMGAVKFNHVLPWERDADITVLSKDFHVLKGLKMTFQSAGYTMHVVAEATCCFEGVITGGIINMNAHGWHIEVYGQHKLTSNKTFRTKVKFADGWLYVPENPGLYVRNRYGRGIYKHAEHWLSTGKRSGWDTYESGKFAKCMNPGHHACLDQFDGDGDIQFHGLL